MNFKDTVVNMTAETTAKIKKISGIVLNVLIWVFVAFALAVTVLAFAAQANSDGVPELFGKSFVTIESPSMEPIFDEGDLVIIERLSEEAKKTLVKGDIITYRAPIDINKDGKVGDLNTHRIEFIDENGRITTKGDNNPGVDNYTIGYEDILGKCGEDSGISGVGAVIKFLRSSVGFFFCVLLPLAIFFIYELVRFIYIVVTERRKDAPVSKETEEEIKRRAVEEYLKEQAALANAEAKTDSTETEENSSETSSEEK